MRNPLSDQGGREQPWIPREACLGSLFPPHSTRLCSLRGGELGGTCGGLKAHPVSVHRKRGFGSSQTHSRGLKRVYIKWFSCQDPQGFGQDKLWGRRVSDPLSRFPSAAAHPRWRRQLPGEWKFLFHFSTSEYPANIPPKAQGPALWTSQLLQEQDLLLQECSLRQSPRAFLSSSGTAPQASFLFLSLCRIWPPQALPSSCKVLP